MNGCLPRRLFLFLTAALAAVPATAAPPALVTETGADGLTVEFTAPEYTTRDVLIGGTSYRAVDAVGLSRLRQSGYPDLPFTSVPFAVPPGAAVSVIILEIEETLVAGPPPPPAPTGRIEGEGDEARPVEEFIPDPAFYRSAETYPASPASVGPRGRLRFQDVGGVSLHPFRYDAGERALRVASRLVVRVSWGPPGALPKGLAPEPSEDRYWEPVYKSLLPNYEESRAWRARPAPPRVSGAPSRLPALQGEQWKIRVRKTDLYRVDASSLAGFPSGVSLDALRLYERIAVDDAALPYEEIDVPIHVVDADADEMFGAGDYVVFYGRSYAERFASVPMDTLRYTDTHVYWLSLEGGDARMAEAPGHRGYTGLTAPATFETWQKFETNQEYEFRQLGQETVDPWEKRRVFVDHYFWAGPGMGPNYFRFSIHGVDTAAGAGLRARVQGTYGTSSWQVNLAIARVWDDVPGTAVPGTPLTVSTTQAATFDSNGLTIPPGLIGEGNNQVVMTTSGQGVYFDWLEIGYVRRYEAFENRLDMTSGPSTGPSEFALRLFTTRELLLYDVTDPAAPRHLTLDPSQIVRQGQSFTLTFQDEVTAPRRYVAAAATVLPQPAGVVAETAPSVALSDPSRDADYLMIAYDEFLPAIQPLADRRASQGHRVELVTASDVYDEFSGGSPTPFGIKRYLRWAMERRRAESGGAPPAYVLLVGDASADFNGEFGPTVSKPNYLPTLMYFSNVRGTNGEELVAMDPRFVLDLTSPRGEVDWFEDLFLGRISSGSVAETDIVVQKILAYENFGTTDTWRGNVLLIADDQYSTSILGTDNYCRQFGESVFVSTSDEMIRHIHEEAGLRDIATIPFYLHTYLDTVEVLGRDERCANEVQNRDYSRANVTPLLMRKFSQGDVIVTYQGHANSRLIAHEYLMTTPATGFGVDIDQVQNVGKPFVFFGFACHISQFERHNEAVLGDSFGEMLLFAENRGSVASIASTAYEWLHGNPPIHLAVSKAFFLKPPATDLPSGDRTRWVLGPTLTEAKAFMVLDGPGGGFNQDMQGMVETYFLLGDPALRMDALPPQYQVMVDDEEYTPGTRLRAPAGADSVTIRAEIRDELDVRGGSVSIKVGGATVADSLFTVEAPPGSPLVANRPFIVTYRHGLVPDTYDIEISADDLSGRRGTVRIPVVLDMLFRAGGVALSPGGPNALPPSFDAQVSVEAPVGLEEDDFTLLVDGQPVSSTATQNPQDPGGRGWIVTTRVEDIADGSHTLGLRVDVGSYPAVTRTVPFQVQMNLVVRDVFNFPNPFSGETRFYYTLSRDARSASIRIYTVTGRLIRVLEGSVFPGKNIVPNGGSAGWDGRDAEGDPVANGLYFYRVEVTSLDGKKVEVLGRMARAR